MIKKIIYLKNADYIEFKGWLKSIAVKSGLSIFVDNIFDETEYDSELLSLYQKEYLNQMDCLKTLLENQSHIRQIEFDNSPFIFNKQGELKSIDSHGYLRVDISGKDLILNWTPYGDISKKYFYTILDEIKNNWDFHEFNIIIDDSGNYHNLSNTKIDIPTKRKSGRSHLPEDIEAWKRIYKDGQDETDVWKWWCADERVLSRLLVNYRRQFIKIKNWKI